MLSKLKLLFKDTVIYGSSTILARSLNYLLVCLVGNRGSIIKDLVQNIREILRVSEFQRIDIYREGSGRGFFQAVNNCKQRLNI